MDSLGLKWLAKIAKCCLIFPAGPRQIWQRNFARDPGRSLKICLGSLKFSEEELDLNEPQDHFWLARVARFELLNV